MLLTFDLDGVLMKNPFSTGVFPEVGRRLSERGKPEEIRKQIIDEVIARLRAGDLVGAYNWDDVIKVVAARLDYFEPIPIADLVEFYCVDPHIYLYEGVKETLLELRARGYELVALTNGFFKYQYPVLKALGIADLFARIITPDQVGYGKPDPRFYLAAKTDPAEPHIHVGDNVIHDIFGANRVGAVSVWVHHKLPEELKALTPAERGLDTRLSKLLTVEIAKDLCPEACPEASWSNSTPKYAIGEISEIVQIVESESQKST